MIVAAGARSRDAMLVLRSPRGALCGAGGHQQDGSSTFYFAAAAFPWLVSSS